MYYALAVGAVPVYLGAPDIDNYVPPRSIIKVTDFKSAEALASYLQCLVHEQPDLYDFYQNWRTRSNEASPTLSTLTTPTTLGTAPIGYLSRHLSRVPVRAPIRVFTFGQIPSRDLSRMQTPSGVRWVGLASSPGTGTGVWATPFAWG